MESAKKDVILDILNIIKSAINALRNANLVKLLINVQVVKIAIKYQLMQGVLILIDVLKECIKMIKTSACLL